MGIFQSKWGRKVDEIFLIETVGLAKKGRMRSNFGEIPLVITFSATYNPL
jgi:hypothetical protein